MSRGWKALRHQLKVLSLRLMARLPRHILDPMILKRIHAEGAPLEDTVVKIAETPEEHEQASHLLFQTYAEAGLVERRGVPVRVTSFLMMPTTVRFVAVVKGEVVATLSLVQDSDLGLPLELAYGEAVRALRSTGGSIAEIGALGVKPGHRGHGLTMLLYKAMWRMALLLGVRHLVVAVRPEVEMFYAATLRFERLANSSARYPGINSYSTALHLDLGSAEAEFARAFGAHSTSRAFNPYRFFVETHHRSLHLPTTKAALEALFEAQKFAAIRLAWLRPETVMTLAPSEFKALEDALAPAASPP